MECERCLIDVEQHALDRRWQGVEEELADMVLAAEDNEGLMRSKEWSGKGRGKSRVQ